VVIERQRWVRASLWCTTCRIVVAVGPVCEREPLAAYELGRVDHAASAGPLHLGVCAGGALDVLLEEVPNPPPGESYETVSSRSSTRSYETGGGRRGRGGGDNSTPTPAPAARRLRAV
jgi:hypothetical protein